MKRFWRYPGAKGDFLVFLVILSFALLMIGRQIMHSSRDAGYTLAIIGPEGSGRISAGEILDREGQSLYVPGAAGGLTLAYVPEKGFHVDYAACPDQVCVHSGFINKAGQSIVCVPNRITLRLITGGGEGGGELDGLLR